MPGSPPEIVTIAALDSTSIQVNWTEVPDIDQNGAITIYEVEYEPLVTFGTLVKKALITDSANVSITLVDLEEYVEYNISVRAYTSVGPGPFTLETSVQTEEDG